jgi:hypothetical protein
LKRLFGEQQKVALRGDLGYGGESGEVGEHSMPNMLTIAFLAAILVLAGFPAGAVDIPDSGSKNFTPGGDAPSYFTNETVPVSARVADTSQAEVAHDEVSGPPRSASTAYGSRGRHGRFASAGKHGTQTLGRSTRFANAHTAKATGAASLHNTARQTMAGHGTASGGQTVRMASVKSAPKPGMASGSRTGTAKPARTTTRHAGRATAHG